MENLYPDKLRVICFTPIKFKSDEKYKFYPDRIDFIALQKTKKYKFISLPQLYVIATNTLYLNPHFDKSDLEKCIFYVSNTHFAIKHKSEIIRSIINKVIRKQKLKKLKPYTVKRKLIFNPSLIIPIEKKREIIGKKCGGKVINRPESLYEAFEQVQELNLKPTLVEVAKLLHVTERTIRNHMTEELKEFQQSLKIQFYKNRKTG
jgi:hypothetical protein